jgi:hypothetical protein
MKRRRFRSKIKRGEGVLCGELGMRAVGASIGRRCWKAASGRERAGRYHITPCPFWMGAQLVALPWLPGILPQGALIRRGTAMKRATVGIDPAERQSTGKQISLEIERKLRPLAMVPQRGSLYGTTKDCLTSHLRFAQGEPMTMFLSLCWRSVKLQSRRPLVCSSLHIKFTGRNDHKQWKWPPVGTQ